MSEYQLIQKKRTNKSLQELSESSERLEFGEPLYVNDTNNNVAYEIAGQDPTFTIPNNKMMKYHDKNIVDKGVFYKTPSNFNSYGGIGVQLTDDTGADITPDIPASNVFYSKDDSYQTIQNTLDNIYSTGISNAEHANIADVANKINILAAPEPGAEIELVKRQVGSGGSVFQTPPNLVSFSVDGAANSVTFSGSSPVKELGIMSAIVGLTGSDSNSEFIPIEDLGLQVGHTYRVRGCATGGGADAYYIQLTVRTGTDQLPPYCDYGSGSSSFSIPEGSISACVSIVIPAKAGGQEINLEGKVFKPVIEPVTTFSNYFLLGALENNGEQQLYAVPAQYTQTGMVTEAMWNDYAEGRNCPYLVEPGMCMVEDGGGKVRPSEKYLETPAGIVSNTHGMFIGNSVPNAKPIAVAGRVLAFVEDKKDLKVGDALKTAPDGKVAKMTKREMRKHPDKIVGYVSEFPTYENYNNVPVNGRIWVRVK